MDNLIEILKLYFSLGFYIFPVKYKDKTPLTKNGFKDSVNNLNDFLKLVNSLISTRQFNIGIATGKISGFFAVDIDPRNNGHITWDKLLKENKENEINTMQTITGGGGRHILWKYPIGENLVFNKTIGEGVDIKSDGGYIVGPPSIHLSGMPYKFNEPIKEIKEAPDWLLNLVLKNKDFTSTNELSTNFTNQGTLSEGGRNNAIYLHGKTLLKNNFPKNKLRETLHSFNTAICNPSLPCNEVDTITNSLLKKLDRLTPNQPPEFDKELFGIAGNFVDKISPHSEASEVGLYLQFLVTFGSMIGKKAIYNIGATPHFPCEFLVLVGNSSKGRKGSSMDVIEYIFKNRDPLFFEHKVKRNIVSGEGIVEVLKDHLPEKNNKSKKGEDECRF